MSRQVLPGCALVLLASGCTMASPGLFWIPRPEGVSDVAANAISADGTTVVGGTQRGNDGASFYWTAATALVEFDAPIGGWSYASGVSADGRVIVGSSRRESQTSAYRWASGSGLSFLQSTPGASETYANDVSDDGSIIAGYDSFGAVRWRVTDPGIIADPLLFNLSASANAISGDGQVLVGATSAFGPAVRWTPQGTQSFPLLGGLPTGSATVANADGSVIAGVFADGSPFRWSVTDGLLPLGQIVSPGRATPYAMSADGLIIAGWLDSSDDNAFVWTPQIGVVTLESLIDQIGLDRTGWQFQLVTDISADGLTLVGWARYQGEQGSFIAQIPAPSANGVIFLGALLVRRRVRR